MPNPLRISRFRFHRCGRKYILAFSVALSTGWMNFFLFLFIRASDAVPVFFSLPASFARLLSWGGNRRRGLVILIPGVAYYSLVTATAKPLGEFFFTFFFEARDSSIDSSD